MELCNTIVEFHAFERRPFKMSFRDPTSKTAVDVEFDNTTENGLPPWMAKVPESTANNMVKQFPNSYRIVDPESLKTSPEPIEVTQTEEPQPKPTEKPIQPEPVMYGEEMTPEYIGEVIAKLTTPAQERKVREVFEVFRVARTKDHYNALVTEIERQTKNAESAKERQAKQEAALKAKAPVVQVDEQQPTEEPVQQSDENELTEDANLEE